MSSSGTLDAEGNEQECQGAVITILLTVPKEVVMSDQGTNGAGANGARWVALIAGGAVVGAGIGLLFAPRAGTETRREIARYAKKAQVQATRLSRALQSGVKEVMDRSKRPVIEAA